MNQTVEEFIKHHGVKGMKWGSRKSSGNRPSSSDFKKTAHLRKRKTHELSNKQLQNVNSRINLEQNYKKLNPNVIERGHATTKQLLSFGATAIAVHTMINTPQGQAVIAVGKSLVKKALSNVK